MKTRQAKPIKIAPQKIWKEIVIDVEGYDKDNLPADSVIHGDLREALCKLRLKIINFGIATRK